MDPEMLSAIDVDEATPAHKRHPAIKPNNNVAKAGASSAATGRATFGFAHLNDDELALKARIFINMAAYRDKRCHETVWQAITRAALPRRLTFGIYQQHDAAQDPDCLQFRSLCEKLDVPGGFDPANRFAFSLLFRVIDCFLIL